MPCPAFGGDLPTKRSHNGMPLRSFGGLLSMLATLCSNTCRVGEGKHATRFQRPTEASARQREAFRLLGVNVPDPGKVSPVSGTEKPPRTDSNMLLENEMRIKGASQEAGTSD